MNIFETIQMYAGKWNVKKVDNFTPEEIAMVDHAEVVSSEFGKSVCFFMKDGRQGYIPLDKDDEQTIYIGTKVDMTKVSVVTLSRVGDADIKRIKFK